MNAITDVKFINGRNLVASASKDGFVKIWETTTQHCIQTLVGHRFFFNSLFFFLVTYVKIQFIRGEVLGLCLNEANTRMVTSSSDGKLRLWKILNESQEIAFVSEKEKEPTTADSQKRKRTTEEEKAEIEKTPSKETDDMTIAELIGEIPFTGLSSSQSTGKVSSVSFSPNGKILTCIMGEKNIVFFTVCFSFSFHLPFFKNKFIQHYFRSMVMLKSRKK